MGSRCDPVRIRLSGSVKLCLICRDVVAVGLGPEFELPNRLVQGEPEVGEFVGHVTGTVAVAVRSTSPSRVRDFSVCASISDSLPQ